MSEIAHSGRTFASLGRGDNGWSIWPIEEYLVRRKHSPAVAARIARLNPNGKEEGARPSGWYPHSRSWSSFDGMRIIEFCKRFGSEKFRALPKEAFMRVSGKRRMISRLWLERNV